MKPEAERALAPLSAMAKTSRSTPIQRSYHSADGAVMLLDGRYAMAVAEFQEDPRNPLSLRLLAEAETKAGEPVAGQQALVTLRCYQRRARRIGCCGSPGSSRPESGDSNNRSSDPLVLDS